jgi:D-glycero-alpha-D-manno-heptose-7-phosphate kinase
MRFSLGGGGSDLPGFLKFERLGKTLTTTLNKYVYVSIHESSNKNFRLVYSEIEECKSVSEISHSLLKQLLVRHEPETPIELFSIADLPARGTGLGASSAFCLASVAALHKYNGVHLSSTEAATEASYIEMVLCKNASGFQDQFASALGSISLNTFDKDGLTAAVDICAEKGNTNLIAWLNDHLAFVRVDGSRDSNSILSRIDFENQEIREIQKQIMNLTDPLVKSLAERNLGEFATLLNLNWELKKSITPLTSNLDIDLLIKKGLNCGALGAKLLGAGGSGYVVFVVNKPRDFLDIMGLSDTGIRISGDSMEVMEI